MTMCNTREAESVQAFLAGESNPRRGELLDRFSVQMAKHGDDYVRDILESTGQQLIDDGTFRDDIECNQAVRAVLAELAN